MFPGLSYPMELTGMPYDKTGSGNFKMAASKPEVHIAQPLDIIGTRFQKLCLYFEVQPSHRTIKNIARPNWKWVIQDGGLQTGSIHISACRLNRNTISKAISKVF